MSKKSLEFYAKSNDYFGTIATILSLIRQNINNKKFQETDIKALEKLEKDLIFLQEKYKIIKK